MLGCLCCAGFSRQGGATATLSVFVEPLTRQFGWSRTAVSGAVSLGGVLAALPSPLIGPMLDRHGSRLALCLAVLGTGVATLLLSLTNSLLVFYLLFCIARMNWAGPFELGIYSALNNWFVARRALATSIATVAQMAGLVAMPLIAELAMRDHGWRAGWLAIGMTVLAVGFVPVALLMVRRPEDLGLEPDRRTLGRAPRGREKTAAQLEPSFTRRQAVRTPAFWLLLLYTVLVYPVQAGVSLHQAANLIERGIAPTIAAAIVSLFSLMSAVASAACGLLPRALPIKYPLALTGAFLAAGTLLMIGISSAVNRCGRRGALRLRHRRHADPAAVGLGRLFRPGELRRDPRPGIFGAGAGAGLGAAAVGRAARLDRQLCPLLAMLCGAVRAQHRGGAGLAPATPRKRLVAPRRSGPRRSARAAPALSSNCSSTS